MLSNCQLNDCPPQSCLIKRSSSVLLKDSLETGLNHAVVKTNMLKPIRKYKKDLQNFSLLSHETDSREVADMGNDSTIFWKPFHRLHNTSGEHLVYDMVIAIVWKKNSSHSE